MSHRVEAGNDSSDDDSEFSDSEGNEDDSEMNDDEDGSKNAIREKAIKKIEG